MKPQALPLRTFEVLVVATYVFWPPLEAEWAKARVLQAQDYADAVYQVAAGQPPTFHVRVRLQGSGTAGALYTVSPQGVR